MPNPTGKNQYGGKGSGVTKVKKTRESTTTTFKSGVVMKVFNPGVKVKPPKPITNQKRLKAIFGSKYG